MPYCRACGGEVGANTTYCPECGEELNFKPVEPEGDNTDSPTDFQRDSEPDRGTESKTGSGSSGISIWAKIGVVICVPIAAIGMFLEIASVYTLSIGGYTWSEFGIVSVVFGLMILTPSVYLYYIYAQIDMSPRDIV